MRTRDQIPGGAKLLGVAVVREDDMAFTRGVRFAYGQAADSLGLYPVVCRDERDPRNEVWYVVPLTKRERAIIEEGIAMYYDAARETPELLSRFTMPRPAEV